MLAVRSDASPPVEPQVMAKHDIITITDNLATKVAQDSARPASCPIYAPRGDCCQIYASHPRLRRRRLTVGQPVPTTWRRLMDYKNCGSGLLFNRSYTSPYPPDNVIRQQPLIHGTKKVPSTTAEPHVTLSASPGTPAEGNLHLRINHKYRRLSYSGRGLPSTSHLGTT